MQNPLFRLFTPLLAHPLPLCDDWCGTWRQGREAVDRLETIRMTKSDALSDSFVVAGDRAYLIGAQRGDFPALGWHTPGKMGGLWAPPIRLLDGFELAIEGEPLPPATRYLQEAFSGRQEHALGDLRINRSQFVPDGSPAAIIRFTFSGPAARQLRVRFSARVDLRGVWPGAESGPSEAVFAPDLGAWVCTSRDRPWAAVIGPAGQVASTGHHAEREGDLTVILNFEIALEPETPADLTIVVAGSDSGAEEATRVFSRLAADPDAPWSTRAARTRRFLERSVLAVPDAELTVGWDWLKCNYDWLVREVPGIGRGLSAGLPHYPWWFGCDAAYALLGALALGRHDLCIDTLDLLREASERANKGSGRVIHEQSTSGVVCHPGNVQETTDFVSTLAEVVRWTGDMALLERSYDFCRRGLAWVEQSCLDGTPLPYGYGITERRGLDLQCVDSAASTAGAFESLAYLADLAGDEATADHARQQGNRARIAINALFWQEDEGLYADMLATPAEILSRAPVWLSSEPGVYYESSEGLARQELQALVERARSARHPDEKDSWLLKFWIVLSPLLARAAPRDRAMRVLDRLESEEFTGPWGLTTSALYRSDPMSVSTGAMAVAEAAYGRPDAALCYIHALLRSLPLGMPGAIAEILPAEGCCLQGWSGYGIAWPVVSSFFGVRPDAARKHVTLAPCFPPSWTEAHLTNLPIGSSCFDLRWDGERLQVTSSEPWWTADSGDGRFDLATC